MDDGFNIKLFKLIKKDIKGVLLFDLSKTNTFNNISKKRTIPVARGYFPEDFSLNINLLLFIKKDIKLNQCV